MIQKCYIWSSGWSMKKIIVICGSSRVCWLCCGVKYSTTMNPTVLTDCPPSSLQCSACRTSAVEPLCRARRSTSSTSCRCPSPSSPTSSPSPWPTAWTPSWCTDALTRWPTRPAAPKATAWNAPSPSVHRRAPRRTAPATTVKSLN